MKKTLLCLALGLTGFLSASAAEETYLPRNNWVLTTCSDINEGNGSGPSGCMIDDDVNTYWHQNWSSDTSGNHWFVIDLGFETQVDGFDYWKRQNSDTGRFVEGKAYVSNTPFSFPNHGDAKTYADNADNTPAGTFTFDYDSDANGRKRCTFPTPVTGRYLFVFISNSGDHACCGDFKVFTTGKVKKQHDTQYWSVTPCSQSSEEGDNGPASLMFDDNPSTFWHQAWESGEKDLPHWFIVDMQHSVDVDGFSYWRRQGNSNGSFQSGKVYVNDEGFTPFADHDAAVAYYNNEENVAAGSFTFDFAENPNVSRVCEFEQTAHGRYMLVMINQTTTGDACCGSFKPFYIKGKNLENDFNISIAHRKEQATILSVLGAANPGATMPSTEIPAGTTVQNIDEKIAEVNAALQDYIDSFNDKQITIKCALRRQNNPYLGAVVKGNRVDFNTLTAGNPDAAWLIKVVDNGIHLYNRTTGLYIATNLSATANVSEAQTFVPAIQTQNGTDYVMFYLGNSNVFLSVDTRANNLSSYTVVGDQGAPWIIETADATNFSYDDMQVSSETEKHYYRIISARRMFKTLAPNMAVNGENQNGSGEGESNNFATANAAGMYWSFEDAGNGDGSVYVTNLTGRRLQENGFNEQGQGYQATLTTEGSALYLVKQSHAQFNGVNCYAISTAATVGSSTCLDVDNTKEATGNAFRWNPTSENTGNGNNGALWYLIAANDEEIANATAAYIAAVKSRSNLPVKDETLQALLGEEFMATINDQYYDEYTIDVVNAAKYEGASRVNAIKAAIEAEIGNNLAGNFMIQNANTSYTNCFLSNSLFTPEEGEQYYRTTPTAETNDLNSLWAFEPTEGGYILRSSGNGMAITKTDATSTPIPMNETGLAYTIGYNPIVPGFNITLAPESEGADVSYYALHQSNNTVVCKWIAQNIAGSHWHINLLDEADVEFAKAEDGHTMTLGEGVTLNDHASAEGLSMTITKLPEESEVALASIEPADGVHTISAADFENGTVNLAGLTTGKYEVSAPAGMFLVNGKHANLKSTFTVDTNGDPLAIDEIEAANAGATVIYDLQGRRVNRAAHGIYIVNGRKVIL